MRVALFVGLALVVAAAVSEPAEPVIGYHMTVGIPQAAKIKALEEELFGSHGDDRTLNSRIVGGSVAATNSHPYLGGIVISFVNIAGYSVCGSSIITANRLVTAAHCWFDGLYQAREFEVVLGSHWLFFGGTRLPTTQVVMHSAWNPNTLANDVAVIYLPTNVGFSAAVQPIALPSTNQLWNTFAGQWSIASGYGMTSDSQTGVTTSAVVSEVRLQVISVAQCQAFFGTWAQASNICTAGTGGIGVCGGDSGGPLVVNANGQNILVGISSFVGWGGCQLGYPSVFARVTSFYSFILSHL